MSIVKFPSKFLKKMRDLDIEKHNKDTLKPESGEWILISPSGKRYLGDSPLRCVSSEMNQRIPAKIRAARLQRFLREED